MTTTMTSVLVPDGSASRSKMQRKGWKCWAKILSSVDTPANDGYAYHGEFVSVGTRIEIEIGAVLLHVDQSSSADLGVVCVNSAGEGRLVWLSSADSTGRQWCGTLARTARTLLALDVRERIQRAAQSVAAGTTVPCSAAVQAYWDALAAGQDEAAAAAAMAAVEAAVSAPAPEATAVVADESTAVAPDATIAVLADQLRRAIAAKRDRLVGRQRGDANAARQVEIDTLGDEYRQVYAVALRAGLDSMDDAAIAAAWESLTANP